MPRSVKNKIMLFFKLLYVQQNDSEDSLIFHEIVCESFRLLSSQFGSEGEIRSIANGLNEKKYRKILSEIKSENHIYHYPFKKQDYKYVRFYKTMVLLADEHGPDYLPEDLWIDDEDDYPIDYFRHYIFGSETQGYTGNCS
ncbi:hypothetical protein [Ileibacterium valens]|uniref:hypothetical protein n=1 Tax=Ileibacterium valens TaxID=1862668 RepID=UPI00272D6BAA|nr:hypothetical protein [Ileibacterium valens]